MRKTAIILFLSAALIGLASCGEPGAFRMLKYKKEKVGSRLMLINRFSDKVVYYWSGGKWEKLNPQAQIKIQLLYEAWKGREAAR